jgi:hypothetical protein
MAKGKRQPAEGNSQVDDAIFHLRLIQHGCHLVDLYAQLFPRDFAKNGIDYCSAVSVLAAYDRFCLLVNKHMFPCYTFTDWEMDPESLYGSVEYVLETIPMAFHGRAWYDRFDEDLTPVEKLILAMTGARDDLRRQLRPAGDGKFNLPALEEICAGLRSPLRRLPEIVRALTGASYNVYVDISDDELGAMEMPGWGLDQVRWQAKEFKEAIKIWRMVDKFNTWVAARPERLGQVENLLRRSRRKAKKERVKVSNSGRPLVETLGGIVR